MGTRTTITWEKFLAASIEGQKCEWVDGEVVQMSPVSLWHEDVLARLIEYLVVEYCRAHPDKLAGVCQKIASRGSKVRSLKFAHFSDHALHVMTCSIRHQRAG